MNSGKVAINISIPQTLLQKIEAKISGDSRSEKIAKCAEMGYRQLTKPPLEPHQISRVAA